MRAWALLLLIALIGCAEQQPIQRAGPASLEVVPPGYYSAKPRYTNRSTSHAPKTERTKAAKPKDDAQADAPEQDIDFDALEAKADEIGRQLREIRRQMNR